MENHSPPGSPNPSPASELVTLADSILRDCMAESSLANLNTAIYLLAQVWVGNSTRNSQHLKLLSTALLTRFSYSSQWTDVKIAGAVCMFLTGLKSDVAMLQDYLSEELQLDPWQADENPAAIVTLAGNILADFHQSINLSSLDTVIVLYKEALSAQDSLGPDALKTLRQVTNAHLMHSRATGDMEDVQESISLLRQLYMAHPNQVSCLCAALLSEVRITNVLEASVLIQETSKLDTDGVELGQDGAEFLVVFQQAGHDSNLDMAISTLETAAALVTWGHEHQASIIGNLGAALHARSKTRGNPEDLYRAIGLWREELDLRPAPHPNRYMSLNHLANGLHQQYETRGDPADLDSAIGLHSEALDLCPTSDTDRSMFVNNLGIVLYRRFQTRGDAADLDKAIGMHLEALDSYPAPHPHRGSCLNDLARVIYKRFQMRGDTGDLDTAIVLHSEALDLRPAPHPNRGSSLTNLANVLHRRFETKGHSEDLDNAIRLHREVLDLCPSPHPDRGTCLSNLATVLDERFTVRGDVEDLDSAIVMLHEAVELCQAPHPDHDKFLNNLAGVLCERFTTRGDPKDLDHAINLHRKALDLRPAPHPKRDSSLTNVALVLSERFKTRGGAGDLDDAIELYCEALDLHPVPHPDRGMSLNNLANAFRYRFEIRGDPGDLENAILLHREALDLCPAPHPNRDTSLTNLASVLHERFHTRGNIGDLESLIGLYREALDLHPTPHSSRGGSLQALAGAFQERFQTRGAPQDLENAILLHREALDLLPTPHPERGSCLTNLAGALWQRFQTSGDAEDLDSAILLQDEALDLHPAPHPTRGDSLTILAHVLDARFRTTGSTADLDKAIELYCEALDLRPDPHRSRGSSLMNLGQTMIKKYDNCLDLNILHQAVVKFHEGSAYLVSPVSLRCRTSATWALEADKRNHDSALEAYETFVELLPQQAMLGLDIHSRQKALTLNSNIGLVSDAAACAARNNSIGKAIEFLEAGRSVFWSQALQLHTSLDELQSAHPELATRISDISKQLELGSHRDVASIRILPAVHKDHMTVDKEDARYRKMNSEWIQALEEVRQQPGFQRFLRPKLIKELKAAAIHGPIVILNASRSICTAFVVDLSGDVQSISLEGMTQERAESLVHLLHALLSRSSVQIIQTISKIPARDASTTFPTLQQRLDGRVENSKNLDPDKIFGWLLGEIWALIVQPVFHALELKKSSNPSRLWWCPTGLLTFLPIHAAGIYAELGTDCVSDYVVSSYTPTLTSLLDLSTQTPSVFKMTAVIQPETPMLPSLPATKDELTKIREKVPQKWLTSLGDTPPATVDDVLQHLRESSLVHFACHGTQDQRNPLETCLHLTDGRLKVSELMRGKSQNKSMSLAFLSACETAKGDETVPDEAMHLAATLLFAGFRGVVATMWTMADPDGPTIAEMFYQHLFKGCDADADPPILPDLTKAAEALHIAVKNLREDPEVSFSRWVPFVHYGL
ncbi:CHAT domain-containing protein [Mycena epipterygia]|nr:CHAT domain-containing protein [Mycena epipterygia]